jgi:very-short-patch-repair endonuclease
MSRDFAKQLRHNSTPAEWRLWHVVKGRQLAGAKFRRQVPVGPYVADFLCVAARLIVEIDGSQHADAVGADASRTQYLEEQGHRVVRSWNNEVTTNLDGVVRLIKIALAERPPSP